jgi:hypothetical protein
MATATQTKSAFFPFDQPVQRSRNRSESAVMARRPPARRSQQPPFGQWRVEAAYARARIITGAERKGRKAVRPDLGQAQGAVPAVPDYDQLVVAMPRRRRVPGGLHVRPRIADDAGLREARGEHEVP